MKIIQNKYILIGFLMTGFTSLADTNPPAPASTPVGPGLPIDNNIYFLLLIGVVFSFLFLKKYSISNKKD